MHEGSRRAVIAAFLANLGIACAKFVAFAFTGAASMLAEAIHSVADTGNQGLLLLGANQAKRGPSDQHPFGYSSERFFWAFVVSVVLFSVGGVFALVEGIDKLRHPHSVDDPIWAFGVLLAAVVMEGLSFRTAYHEALPLKNSKSWTGFIRSTKNPEIIVVLLEDSGALLGLTFALAGVLLAWLTGDARFDACGSIAIGVLLIAIAGVLARENRSLLIGEAAEPETIAMIESAIASSPEVTRLIHLRTLHLGPEDLLVTAKIEFLREMQLRAIGRAIDDVEVRIRASVPSARMIFIEPDVFRSDDAVAD